MLKIIFGFIILFSSWNGFADESQEKRKIDDLINMIKNSNATFIRNGENHSSLDAAKHLKMKYRKAKILAFFSGEKIEAKIFIKKVASRSSATGKPYKMKIIGKKEILVEDWLLARLHEIEQTDKKPQEKSQ